MLHKHRDFLLQLLNPIILQKQSTPKWTWKQVVLDIMLSLAVNTSPTAQELLQWFQQHSHTNINSHLKTLYLAQVLRDENWTALITQVGFKKMSTQQWEDLLPLNLQSLR